MLTGDTVLGRGTTVVAHPDGQLGAYLDSLHRLHALAEAQEVTAVWPGHGPVHRRRARRPGLLPRAPPGAARAGPGGAARPRRPGGRRTSRGRSSRRVYADVDPVLWGAAELSVRAQLDYLRG